MKEYNRKQFISISLTTVATYITGKHLNISPNIKKLFDEYARYKDVLKAWADRFTKNRSLFDCVITDNMNYILFFSYNNNTMQAPMICYKYEYIPEWPNFIKDLADLANNHNIVMYNKPEIFSMLKTYDHGDVIPKDAYYEVSKIYADLYKRRGARKSV